MAGRAQHGRLLFSWFPIYSKIAMAQRVRDYVFVLSIDEYRLLKDCLPRHSIGYAAFDLAASAVDEKRVLTLSENELEDVIRSVGQTFPTGKALANLIRQRWQPISKSRNQKPQRPKKR